MLENIHPWLHRLVLQYPTVISSAVDVPRVLAGPGNLIWSVQKGGLAAWTVGENEIMVVNIKVTGQNKDKAN